MATTYYITGVQPEPVVIHGIASSQTVTVTGSSAQSVSGSGTATQVIVTGQVAAQGPQGEQGPTGATGLQGPPGQDGADGVTDYNELDNLPDLSQYATTSALTTGLATKAATSHNHAISDVTSLQTALDAKATPADISTAITNLIGTAPSTLDTLGEISDALNDDADLAATLMAAIDEKSDTTHSHAVADLNDLSTFGVATGDLIQKKASGWGVVTYPIAEDLSYTPSGSLSATNVQTALTELDTEKADSNHAHDAADVTYDPATVSPTTGGMYDGYGTVQSMFDRVAQLQYDDIQLIGAKADTVHSHDGTDVTPDSMALEAIHSVGFTGTDSLDTVLQSMYQYTEDVKDGHDALALNAKGYVNHGATGSTARPSGYASVEWYGSVEPVNALDGDTWVDTS